MKFQRLKTTNGTGTIMRYFELGENVEAEANKFYEIVGNKAILINTPAGPNPGNLIGFSHGGDKLAKGLILLDVNPAVLYMCILGDGDTDRPNIGDTVFGFLKVIDTHYEEEKIGKGTEKVGEYDGKDVEEWGVETLDDPYYIACIGNGGYGSAIESTTRTCQSNNNS